MILPNTCISPSSFLLSCVSFFPATRLPTLTNWSFFASAARCSWIARLLWTPRKTYIVYIEVFKTCMWFEEHLILDAFKTPSL